MDTISKKLNDIKKLCEDGMNASNTVKALELIGIYGYTEETIKEFKLWNDYMPLSDECPYTDEQRNLHILWECIDKVPLGINCAFSIPFRQILAKKLFAKCGDGFIANENCRFNFANKIEIGDNVSWNAGCYIDAKGGVKFGDFSMMTEYVKIFTHSHSEGDHMIRSYAPVEIGAYSKIYTSATILPGVKMDTFETPGHSLGGMCFYFPEYNILLTGDTLFRDGVGRNDLPGGSIDDLRASIKKIILKNYPDETYVVHGHGADSMIKWLKENHPWFIN